MSDDNDHVSEAEALRGWEWFGLGDEPEIELEIGEEQDRQRIAMKARYTDAKAAKVGSVVECPYCRRTFVKRSYQQAFCSNGRKTHRNCKDRYWNRATPARLERALSITGRDS